MKPGKLKVPPIELPLDKVDRTRTEAILNTTRAKPEPGFKNDLAAMLSRGRQPRAGHQSGGIPRTSTESGFGMM